MTKHQTTFDRIVSVDLGSRSYDIVINAGGMSHVGTLLTKWLKLEAAKDLRVLLIADAAVYKEHGRAVERSLEAAGVEVRSAIVPSGEQSKSYAQTQALYDQLVDMTADRKTLVVAVGGGVTGDLAGFVAATYARGLRFVQVPTTLLSMVDSSVGGKTGINHPRGKNLIGAFHQPVGVIIDLETLSTLPDREYRSGLAEVVKYGVILDAEFFEYLERNVAGLNSRDSEVMRRCRRAVNSPPSIAKLRRHHAARGLAGNVRRFGRHADRLQRRRHLPAPVAAGQHDGMGLGDWQSGDLRGARRRLRQRGEHRHGRDPG